MKPAVALLLLTSTLVLAQHWEFERVDTVSWARRTWLFEHPELGLTVVYAGDAGQVAIASYDTGWVTRNISLPSARWGIWTFDIAPDGRLGTAFIDTLWHWHYADRTPDSAWQLSPLPLGDWYHSNCALAFENNGQPHVLCGTALGNASVGLVLHTTRIDTTWAVDTVARHQMTSSYSECWAECLQAIPSGGLAGLYLYTWSLPDDEGQPIWQTVLHVTVSDSGPWTTSEVASTTAGGISSIDMAIAADDSVRYCYSMSSPYERSFRFGPEQVDTTPYSSAALALDQEDRPLIACDRGTITSRPMYLLYRDSCWHWLEPGVDSAVGLDVRAGEAGEVMVSYAKQGVWLARGSGIAGITETPVPERLPHPAPTISRGVLFLPREIGAGHNPILPGESGLCPKPVLLDASGRRVLDLHPGENDIRHLSPGIYFIREEGSRVQGAEGSRVRKVLILR